MKKILFILAIIVSTYHITEAQKAQTLVNTLIRKHNVDVSQNFEIEETSLFSTATSQVSLNSTTQISGLYLSLNNTALNNLKSSAPQKLSLTLPNESNDGTNYTLQLVKVSGPPLRVKNSKDEYIQYNGGVINYQGIVKGLKNSIAAISLMDNGEIAGVISHSKGNVVLAKVKKDSRHILYRDAQLKDKLKTSCYIDDRIIPIEEKTKSTNPTTSSTSGCKIVRAYFEIDYDLFVKKGSSISATADYMSAIFNQVQLLYNNDGIEMLISEIKVWDTVDPYASISSTSSLVSAFTTNLNGAYDGDLAHFISGRISSLGGGIAYTIPLEICTKALQTCVSAIYDTFEDVPTYSWTVSVITHEMGHILGSRHTHWCGWVGGPIDGCSGFVESDSSGFSCSVGPIPPTGGTIMSYCHQRSVGINFTQGFGPQPKAIIQTKITEAGCLLNIGSGSPPSNLSVDSVKMTSVVFSWDTILNNQFYTIEFKPSSSLDWEELAVVDTNFVNIAGLSANTSYDVRVKGVCSTFSPSFSFTTALNDLAFLHPLPDTLWKNYHFQVPYFAANFNSNNHVNLEISDLSGSFGASTSIGYLTRDTSGVLSALIPNELVDGDTYMLRLTCDNPAFISKPIGPLVVNSYGTTDSVAVQALYPTETSVRVFAESRDSLRSHYTIDFPSLNPPSTSQIINKKNSNGYSTLRSGILDLTTTNQVHSKIIDELYPGNEYILYSTSGDTTKNQGFIVSRYFKTEGSSQSVFTYCAPELDCSDDDLIDLVSIPSLNIYNSGSGCSPNGYSISKNIYTGYIDSVYSFEISTNYYWKEYLDMWVDFDHDGNFTSSEKVYSSNTKDFSFSDSFTIPSNTQLGLTTLRVKMSFADSTRNDACQNNLYFGEVEDYKISLRKNCKEEISLVSTTDDVNLGTGRVHRAQSVTANNKISTLSAADIYSTRAITLLPGFEAQESSIFKATIDEGCGEESY